MLWNLVQEIEIDRLRSDRAMSDGAHEARASSARADVDALYARFDKMVLVLDACWELLSERAGVTEADLLAKIAEIDVRDGTADGRKLMRPRKCSKCNAAVANNRATCAFCGHAEPGHSGIDSI